MNRLPILAAALLFTLAACGETTRSESPRIQTSSDSLVFNTVPIGLEDGLILTISNVGQGTLRVTDVFLDATPADFFRVEGETSFEIPAGETVAELIVFYRPTNPAPSSGDLVIISNDPSEPRLRLPLETPRPAPAPAVVPSLLNFGSVLEGSENVINAEIRNVGLSPLIICNVQVVGSPEISSDVSARADENADAEVGFTVIDVYDLDGGIGINELFFDLFYSPQAPGSDVGELVITYDETGDVANACASTLEERFNIEGAVGEFDLEISPCPLDFRERPVDGTSREAITLTNRGEFPVEIFDIRLDDARTNAAFGLSDVPEFPLAIPVGEADAFTVTFSPNDFLAKAGIVQIEHTDRGERVVSECALAGVGVDNPCPTAQPVGLMREDSQSRRGTDIDWALPLQTLVLDGTGSFDPDGGSITDYQWDVIEKPPEAINGIEPFSVDPDNPAFAEFFIPVAGRYVFELTVFDDVGFASCGDPARVTVIAIPDEAISIELTWTTPGDPDETTGDGSDLDLHFVKMPAPWFDPTFDTYFSNQTPTWSPEEPSLDIDDTDGGGPETTQLDNPENCQWYAIGVHYFREAFGTAWPNIRIFVNGNLVDEIINRPLRGTDDFWDVARVHWPSGTVIRVDEVIDGFNSGDTVTPAFTDRMRASGLCGSEG